MNICLIIICVVATWLNHCRITLNIRWSGINMMEILSIKGYNLEKFMVR